MNNTSKQFISFAEAIQKRIQEKLGKDYTVELKEIRKNNGIQLTGIVAGQLGSNTSPTIYVDGFYREGITPKEIEKIADALSEDFKTAEYSKNIDMSDFQVFASAKKRVAFKLVNAQKNSELLKLIPHKLFYDLAIVFYYAVQEPPFYGKAAILIYNSHLKLWNTDAETLYREAMANTPRLFPGVVEDMESIMCTILRDQLGKDLEGHGKKDGDDIFGEEWITELIEQMADTEEENRMQMYVLTNKQKLQGAACVLYPGLLKEFAEKIQKSFYVLPSSVHEVILVPGDLDADHVSLKEIVTDINHTQVADEEVLADSVYYYDKNLDRLVWVS